MGGKVICGLVDRQSRAGRGDHMKEYGPSTFGELNAADYDELHDPGTTDQAVALLADLAQGGSVYELAIGTGRVALPLKQLGLEVQGSDASPEMVAKLCNKPGGANIPVTIGNMVDVPIEGQFDLIYLIFNTLFNLPSQADQVACIKNATRHLTPTGVFVLEMFVPDIAQFRDNQNLKTKRLSSQGVTLEASVHDPVHQRIDYQYIRMTEDGMKSVPLPMRYAWPQEVDLMAQLAGLERKHRWGGWQREPFTADSKMHVSVYGLSTP